jgi:hypothetical protein
MNGKIVEDLFPQLKVSGYSITSPPTQEYNCIAWAAGDGEVWWWPDPMNIYYWPPQVQRVETIETFIMAYETLGYVVCDTPEYEPGFEKIAIYEKDGKPTHAARQLNSGHWTSKLGRLEDIEHPTLNTLVGSSYGSVAVLMKRATGNPS